ncbi:hypothetical protein BGY98DRAFT_987929 [Russula aff. rugulosa BPL654]|nr:hypothetical protein BGY98DRAFT_987929 [Russula aff. rugulosa BPL654]
MGCLASKPKVEPSVPAPEKPQSSQQTPLPGGTTSTPPPGPGSTKGARARAQSHGAPRRHNNDRQEMASRQYPSGGAVPMQRNRSMSMDVTALKGAPSHSSGRRNRTTSTAVQGSSGGHQRVGTKSMSAATSQTPAGRQGGRSRFPFALQSLLPNDFRFRILVVGKRECGKSSLIRAIFKADMSRSPINVSGRTAEFRPPDNRHLVVHECSASGSGEMQAIRDFITTRNHKSRPDSESLHAIW